jgi:hypothetical protein
MTAVEAMASSVTSDVVAGDPAASTGPASGALSSPPRMAAATTLMSADDNTVKELEVIMRH